MPNIEQHLEQLDREGYTVFKNFLDTETTARIRAHMDSLLPEYDAEKPGIKMLRHPIEGAIMADILANPNLIELAQHLIGSDDLRLLEQVLIRTDGPFPPSKAGPTSWHTDMAFRPEHYDASPRQVYFHMVQGLNNVPPGGGAFTILPGSHKAAFEYAATVDNDEDLRKLEHSAVAVTGVSLDDAIEVLAEDGDLIVFNPMALHSASNNTTTTSRYVYFASFFHPSAQYLQDRLNATNYRGNFPDSLRDNLPEELQVLLTA